MGRMQIASASRAERRQLAAKLIVKLEATLAAEPIVERPQFGKHSGNHNGRGTTYKSLSVNETLRLATTVEDLLQWHLNAEIRFPNATIGTRRKWQRTVDQVQEKLKAEAAQCG